MHTLNPITKGLWLALLLAGGTASEHLLAADAAENDAGKTEPSLKTVTVTAQHREETLQEVPVAVSAVQGTSIIADGVRSMGDITTFIPNASAKTPTATGARAGTSVAWAPATPARPLCTRWASTPMTCT